MTHYKRKNAVSHYSNDFNDFNDDNVDVKKNLLNIKRNKGAADICVMCNFGKLYDMCRCSANCETITIELDVYKYCIYCTEMVSKCDCDVALWAIVQCDKCKITHSIYQQCSEIVPNIKCIVCDKTNTYTNEGCRCMHNNMKYVYSDLDLKTFSENSDYITTYDKKYFQPICNHCSKYISVCKCFDQNLNVLDDYDEYDDYYKEKEEYETNEKDFREQMDCD
jgi:hypothetical protein